MSPVAATAAAEFAGIAHFIAFPQRIPSEPNLARRESDEGVT
jgi:hypothetical protein